MQNALPILIVMKREKLFYLHQSKDQKLKLIVTVMVWMIKQGTSSSYASSLVDSSMFKNINQNFGATNESKADESNNEEVSCKKQWHVRINTWKEKKQIRHWKKDDIENGDIVPDFTVLPEELHHAIKTQFVVFQKIFIDELVDINTIETNIYIKPMQGIEPISCQQRSTSCFQHSTTIWLLPSALPWTVLFYISYYPQWISFKISFKKSILGDF